VRKADNLPPSCAVVTKSESLNFLEPSGPLPVYNGTDLPFIYIQFSVQNVNCESSVFGGEIERKNDVIQDYDND